MYYLNRLNNQRNRAAWPSLFSDVDKQLETLFSDLPSIFDWGNGDLSSAFTSPASRWFENDEAYVARIDLPGMKAKEIELELKDRELSIVAESKESKKKDGAQVEGSRSYRRTFIVPDGIDESKISASYEDGVLAITLPKSEETKARKIEIGLSN